MAGVPLRGIIEGFYGPPWSPAERAAAVDRAADLGLNVYVHAPKDDPSHRERWREPLSDERRAELRALIERGAERGVRVGAAIAPGLDMAYGDPADGRALQARYAELAGLGARFLVLALDDVSSRLGNEADARRFGSLAEAHVHCLALAREAAGDDAEWALVPVDYLGCGPSDYLDVLGEHVPPEVHIAWTGPTVLSPAIAPADARARAAALRRPPLLWDNLPAADGPMRRMLHLGPYRGRPPELWPELSGVLLNPMQHARASFVTIGAAAPLLDGSERDTEVAWRRAVARLAPEAPEAFLRFAQAHRFSPQCGERDPELEPLWERLRAQLEGDAVDDATLEAFAEAVREREAVVPALREALPAALRAELEPWLESHALETARMAAAARAVAAVRGAASGSERVRALLVLEGGLTQRPVPVAVSYGPRRVLYPQLGSMRDDAMHLLDDSVLLRDRCLPEEVLRAVEDWALRHTTGERA